MGILYFFICMWTFFIVYGIPEHPQIGMKFLDIAARHGYHAEEHEVESEDGYFIRHHRIPYGKNKTQESFYPIIVIPGLTATSECFILLEDDESVGFVLADNGYDVWVLNIRGNIYGRKHRYLDYKVDKEFWDYSFHECAYYDLAAAVDYILRETGKEKVGLLGHSLGSAVMFVFLSTRPEYMEKVHLMVHFAPSAYLGGTPIPGFQFIIKHIALIKNLLDNVFHFMYVPGVDQEFSGLSNLCTLNYGFQELCYEMVTTMEFGSNRDEVFNKTLIPSLLSHMPSSISLKSTYHYAQIFSTGEFKNFDYGTEENLKHYNSTKPPEYPLHRITTPCALFYNPKDILSPYTGVQKLNKTLQHPILFENNDPNLRHLFYLLSRKVKTIYPKLLPLLKKYRD